MPFETAMVAGTTIACILGLALVSFVLGRKYRNRSLLEHGHRAAGVVVRAQRPSGARPIAFEYQDASGRMHQLVDGLALLVPALGQPVEVSYDPQRPERAVVARVAGRQETALLLVAAVLFVIAGMLALSGLVLGPELDA